jgi:phosphoribosyl-AMP cyclohydrolase
MAALASPFPAAVTKADLEEGTVLSPRFGPDGLVTCVTTDAETGEPLMVAHMNAEALARTIETGEAWYWSRSRGALWHKGDTSGQVQSVVEMRIDCDQDAIWLRVRVAGDGGCCHTGRRSCFYRVVAQDGAPGGARLRVIPEAPSRRS